jgi:hypothetical protein
MGDGLADGSVGVAGLADFSDEPPLDAAAAGGYVQAGTPAWVHAARNAVAPTPPAISPLRRRSVRRLTRTGRLGETASDGAGLDRSGIEAGLH